MSFIRETIYTFIVFSISNAQKYFVEQHSLTPFNGNKLCSFNYDSALASLHSASDYNDALTIIGTFDVFIGLTDATTEGTWLWMDGTTFDYGNPPASSKPPWRSGQPDDWNNGGANPDGEDCVHMNEYGNTEEWNDIFCTADRYALCNAPQITPIFNDPSHVIRIPTPNTQIGTIDILDNINIEFDIKFNSWPSSSTVWGSILHIGDGVTGDERLPAIYIYGGMYIHTSTALIPPWNAGRVQVDGNVLNLGQTYHFSYIQTQETLKIYIDSNQMFDGAVASHAIQKDRKIYLSNTFNTATDQLFDAEVSNLYIATSNAHSPNSFNYNCDGSNRWEIISGSWNINPAGCTIAMTDVNAVRSTVWMGGYDSTSLNWDTYKIEVNFQIDAGDHVGILIRAQSIGSNDNDGEQYFFGIGKVGWENQVFCGKFNWGWEEGPNAYIGVNYGQAYTMRVEAYSNSFDVYINNEYKFTFNDTDHAGTGPYYTGSVGLTGYYGAATYHSIRITFPTDNYLYTVSPSPSPTTAALTTIQPTTTSPTTTTPTTATPTTAIPTTTTPTTAIPTTAIPTTALPTTSLPTTSIPTTAIPTTSNPTTNTPTTSNPTTISPTTTTPTTATPTTSDPTAAIPTTSNPTTSVPTTSNPTTNVPTTSAPTTSSPTTSIPTTSVPTTSNPTTATPTTAVPTTSQPTTNVPTTNVPTTNYPTTNNPTTNIPTTNNPTTSFPTTNYPTTLTPTTTYPTMSPTQGNEGGVGHGTETTMDGNSNGSGGKLGLAGQDTDLLTIILVIVVASLLCSVFCLSICVYKKRQRDKVINQNNAVLEMELQRVQSVGSVSTIPDTPLQTDGITTTNMTTNTTNMPTNTMQNTTEEAVVPIQNAEPDVYSDNNALSMWLTSIGLMEYFDLFIEQGFGEQMSTLSALTDTDLEKMGVKKLAHRKRILLQIENNKNMMNNQYNGYNAPVPGSYIHHMNNGTNGTNGEGPLLNNTVQHMEMEPIDGHVTGGNENNEYEYYYENDDEKNYGNENDSENESDVDNMYEKGDKISPGGPGGPVDTPGNN